MMKSAKMLSLFTLLTFSSLAILSTRAQDTPPAVNETNFIYGDMLPGAPALAPRGSYGVGVQTLQITHPDQVDVVSRMSGQSDARYDRPLTLEVWYPAIIPEGQTQLAEYTDVLPASQSEPAITFTFSGRALRDAQPDTSAAAYPLIIVSHGYTGSRVQLSHLTENLASKGYVVVAIDHTESTNADIGPFQSTLYNRPLDIRFTLDQIEQMGQAGSGSFLSGLVDAQNTALIGYSMGGYGSLNVVGGGYNQMLKNFVGDFASVLLAGDPDYPGADSRVKALIAFAPFGADLSVAGAAGMGFWDDEGLAGITVPTLFIVGSLDDVAGYETGVRHIYESSVNSDRYLLTFENARHNVAANPPPLEATSFENWMRYGEPAWDNHRINNIVEHFATVFMSIHLQNNADNQRYLDVPDSGEWPGFQQRSSVGLKLEHTAPQ